MRIVIAQMKHETNTFSPVPTPLARFAVDGLVPPEGADAYQACLHTGSAIAAFIDLAEEAGAEIVLPVAAAAPTSGPVDDLAYEHMVSRICAAVAEGCDAVLLDLHGAMVTRSHDSGEAELLRRLRALAPHLPIGVALDMHANVPPALARACSALAGYQTYPPVDMYETGLRAGRAVLAALAGRAQPVLAWGQRPLLPHVMRQGSDDSPNRELQARCRQIELEGALSASVFTGFPHADVGHAGLSAAVVTDGDPARARAWCAELLDQAWSARKAFVYQPDPLSTSIARAQALQAGLRPGSGPVVLLDHADNCASGGTMDSTTVLEAVLEAGLDDVAVFALHDPGAVQLMQHAGIGAELRLLLGGKQDLPALGLKGKPLPVRGRVRLICDGRFRNRGPVARGERVTMGPTAVLDTGRAEIVVVSRHVEPCDLAAFQAVGLDPAAKRFVLLKSRVHWRAGLRHLAAAVVDCNGSGVCAADLHSLPWRHLRRPVYPLDPL